MNTPLTVATISFLSLVGAAQAAPAVEFLDVGFLVTDLSEDGTRGCGNVQGDGTYETFYWWRGEGIVRLGRATVPVLGTGAGSPDISHDGTRVSATILSDDINQTQGLWEFNVGWTETMPPMPADGQPSGAAYGSAWGLSGDGTTVVGLYWNLNGRANASSWTQSGGMVHLPQTAGRSARVDATSYDGSVSVGWVDGGGPRVATIWRDGVQITVADGDFGGGGGVWDVTGDGSIAVGYEYDDSVATRVPTIWTWNGSSYDLQNLNFLPGTIASFGQSYLSVVSDDGQIAGGSNVYTQNPGGPRAGVIWTPAGGVMNAVDFLDDLGVSDQIPATFEIREVSAISPDGNVIAFTGINFDLSGFQTMLVYLNDDSVCAGDTNGDNIVNFADLNTVLAAYGQSGEGLAGDVNGDGVVNFVDLNEVLANFGADCN